MTDTHKVEIEENYKDYTPPSWVRATVLRLIDGIPADYLSGLRTISLTGTTADLGASVKINARLISVEKGAVFSVASVMILKNDQVKMLMGENIERGTESAVSLRDHDISGTWKFVCCSGKYWGEIDLTIYESNKIKGQFYDMANKSGGTIEGAINGNIVLFTRNKGEQDYKLTLSDDDKTMTGFFVGNHDGSVGTEVTLTRK